MNEVDGIVDRVADGLAWVRTNGPGSACGVCASKGSCTSEQERMLCLPNAIGARVGDRVVVQAQSGAVMRAVWQVYLLPLILSLAGAISLYWVTHNELAALLGLVAGLAGGFFALWRLRPACNDGQQQILSMVFKA